MEVIAYICQITHLPTGLLRLGLRRGAGRGALRPALRGRKEGLLTSGLVLIDGVGRDVRSIYQCIGSVN